MAIYDNDGTAKYEIGKLYDNDGTANHQIGKVYDFDGTANSLIYTGTPEYLYKDGDQNTAETGGWSASIWYGFYGEGGVNPTMGNVNTYLTRFDENSIWLQSKDNDSAAYGGQGAVTNNMIDFSDINKLTLTFAWNRSNNSYNYVGVLLATTKTDFQNGGNKGTVVSKARNVSGLTEGDKYTVELDTTNYNGSYYVIVYTSSGSTTHCRATIYSLTCN